MPKVIESPELLNLKRIKQYKILVPLSNPARVEPLIEMADQIAIASKGEVIAFSVVDLPDVTAYADAEPFMNQPNRWQYSDLPRTHPC